MVLVWVSNEGQAIEIWIEEQFLLSSQVVVSWVVNACEQNLKMQVDYKAVVCAE